jgi:adenylate cyclase
MFLAGVFQNVNLRITDAFYGGRQPLSNIIIVAIDDKSLQEIGRWPWDRDKEAEIINILSKDGAKVIAVDISFFEPSVKDGILAAAINNASNVILNTEYISYEIKNGKIYGAALLKPAFDSNAELAAINLFSDTDGIVRSFPARIEGIENFDSFAVKIVEKYLGQKPVLPEEKMLINFFGRSGSFRYLSAADVIKSNFDKDTFRDKIVLMGVTAPDLHDDHLTPVSLEKMPGVEIHANIVQTILTKSYLKYEDNFLVVISIFIFSMITTLLLYRFRIIYSTIIIFALAFAYVILSVLAFDAGMIMNVFYPLLAILAVYIGVVIIFYLTEERQKRHIRNLFGKYLSNEVIEDLMKNPEKIKLGGEKKNLTILMSDIRSFTTISEGMDAVHLVSMLNEYLTEMTNEVMEKKGIVDKYIGDAILAFWGAPADEPIHPELACDAALGMVEKLGELNKNFKEKNIPELKIGIGVNTGDVVVGNMGSAHRFDYTVIGDDVNLTSRLEGLTKQYGVTIIASETTFERVREKFTFRELDLVKVKGKKKPVRIYELVGRDVDEKTRKEIAQFHAALSLYRKGEFRKAENEFSKLDDKPSKLFIERCREFMKKRPPKDWDGVFEATGK